VFGREEESVKLIRKDRGLVFSQGKFRFYEALVVHGDDSRRNNSLNVTHIIKQLSQTWNNLLLTSGKAML